MEQFDAPELKNAVRRLYGGERAPAGLRQRVESILRAPQAESRMRISRAAIWQWAAAAVILVGLAGLLIRVNQERSHPVGQATLASMIKTHDFCCRANNRHRHADIPQDNFAAMGQTLASKIHEPVLAANLEGWNFVGAAMCPVNGKWTAHLVYQRNGQWLSVFSVPASACDKVRNGGFGAEQLNDHMIAGFAQTGGVYCMVGSCPNKNLRLEEIQQLLKKHQRDLVEPRPPTTFAMVELLRNR